MISRTRLRWWNGLLTCWGRGRRLQWRWGWSWQSGSSGRRSQSPGPAPPAAWSCPPSSSWSSSSGSSGAWWLSSEDGIGRQIYGAESSHNKSQIIERSLPVEHPEEECCGDEDSQDLQSQPPAKCSEWVVEELADDEDPHTVTWHQHDLHDLPPPLEILADHQGGAVSA